VGSVQRRFEFRSSTGGSFGHLSVSRLGDQSVQFSGGPRKASRGLFGCGGARPSGIDAWASARLLRPSSGYMISTARPARGPWSMGPDSPGIVLLHGGFSAYYRGRVLRRPRGDGAGGGIWVHRARTGELGLLGCAYLQRSPPWHAEWTHGRLEPAGSQKVVPSPWRAVHCSGACYWCCFGSCAEALWVAGQQLSSPRPVGAGS